MRVAQGEKPGGGWTTVSVTFRTIIRLSKKGLSDRPRDTHLVPLRGGWPDASAQTCWSAAVLWQMSRRPMTSVEGPVMDFTTAPGRWPEPSAHHDVHVEHGKDVGDARSALDSHRPFFERGGAYRI